MIEPQLLPPPRGTVAPRRPPETGTEELCISASPPLLVPARCADASAVLARERGSPEPRAHAPHPRSRRVTSTAAQRPALTPVTSSDASAPRWAPSPARFTASWASGRFHTYPLLRVEAPRNGHGESMESFDLNLLIRPNGLLLVRDARRVGAERLVSAAHRDGDLVRLRKGIYVPEPTWRSLSPDDRYRLRIDAAAVALRKDALFSHYSAARLWGLPIVGPWPVEVHTLTSGDRGGRSAPGRPAARARLHRRPRHLGGPRPSEPARCEARARRAAARVPLTRAPAFTASAVR